MKKAIITGITGQDGSYLAELLLEKGYEVHGIRRRVSTLNVGRISHILNNKNFFLHYGDMTDSSSLINILRKVKPDEIYNLAAQSHVKTSFEIPEYTANCDAIGVLRLLEIIRTLNLTKKTKIYQASTSELYGKAVETPQNEKTPFNPRSPYAAAKLYAFSIVKNYREAYGMFAVNGILFNHESERRGESFVTRKITMAASEISLGVRDCLYLGNIYAKRDWGHAKDYVDAMWRMLQEETPQDFVIASGETHTVKEFIELAFKEVNIELIWEGKGINEIGINKETGKTIIKIDPYYFRPTEVDILLGDATKAKKELGWECKIGFKDLVKEMMKYDLQLSKKSLTE